MIGALALVALAATVAISSRWSALAMIGRVGVGLVAAVVGFVGGTAFDPPGPRSSRRIAELLWCIGTAGVALVAATVTTSWHPPAGVVPFVVGTSIWVCSIALWRNLERPLAFVGSLVGVVTCALSVAVVAHVRPAPIGRDVLAWCGALALGVVGARHLRPRSTVLVVSEVAAIVAAFSMSVDDRAIGVLVGLCTGALWVLVGLVDRRPFVVVLGALAYFMFVIRAFTLYVHGTGWAIGSVVLGVTMIAVGLWRSSRSGASTAHDSHQRLTE